MFFFTSPDGQRLIVTHRVGLPLLVSDEEVEEELEREAQWLRNLVIGRDRVLLELAPRAGRRRFLIRQADGVIRYYERQEDDDG